MDMTLSSLRLPIRLRPETPMSDLDLMRFSRENRPLRMEREPNGEIVVMTPAGFGTSKMNQRIGRFLDEWAEADGRGVATESRGGYKLPNGSMRAPDAAWVSIEKAQSLTAQQAEGFAPFVPDFLIELRSPSDRLSDAQAKMEEWIANGVELAWLIDPQRRVVEVYRPNEEPDTLFDPTSVQGTGPVIGFELVMARVWS
jgi:Uma2 family endonuclease